MFAGVTTLSPDLDLDNKGTMNKRRRTFVAKGEELVRQQDKSMWSSLTHGMPGTKKLLVMITMFANLSTQSAGHMAGLIDPGINGSFGTDQCWKDVDDTMDRVDPTLTLFH
eukprot:5946650-Karenia_brevis.AAC.1